MQEGRESASDERLFVVVMKDPVCVRVYER